MQRSLLVGLFFVIQAAYTIQAPDRCCTPAQFQISYGGTTGQTINKQPQALQVFFNGAFDFKKQQYGMDVYIHNYTDGSDLRYKLYQLINKGTEYIVMNSQCVQVPVEAPPIQCVPDSATSSASLFLGNLALLLDSWRVDGSSAGFEGEAYSTTSRDDCIPGPLNAIGKMDVQGQKVSFMTQGTYMNFTNTISQPDYWFVPPPSCSNATKQVSESWLQPLLMLKRLRATSLLL